MQKPIEITGVKFESKHGQSSTNVFLEIGGKWVEVALVIPSAGHLTSYVIELAGIQQCVDDGKPYIV